MSNIYTAFFIVLSTFLYSIPLWAAPKSECVAPQLLPRENKYKAINRLICSAYRLMQEGQYDKSLTLFEKANSVDLWEEPNYYALGYLSLVYARKGEFFKSDLYLEEDEMAQLSGFGIVKCRSQGEANQSPFSLYEGDRRLAESPAVKEVTAILCQEPYGYAYDHLRAANLESNAKGILWHNAIAKEIAQLKENRKVPH